MSASLREEARRRAALFELGDVVFDEEHPDVLGVVTEVRRAGVTVVWAHGGRTGGPGLLFVLRHYEPRRRVEVPEAALGNRGWNREQAVTAALRRAGLGDAEPVRFTVPLRTTTGAGNAREHWTAKARRTAREHQAVVAAWPRELGVQLPLLVRLTRVSPGKPDDDNASAGLKAVRDAVARQLGVDDGDVRWVRWEYRPPRRGKRGEWAVEVELREQPGAPGQARRPAVPLPAKCQQCRGAKTAAEHCAGRQRARGCRCWCTSGCKRPALKSVDLLERAGVVGRLHLPGCIRGGACKPGCPSRR